MVNNTLNIFTLVINGFYGTDVFISAFDVKLMYEFSINVEEKQQKDFVYDAEPRR